MKISLKKLLAPAFSAFGLSAFADTQNIDTTPAVDALASMSSAITGYITQAVPYVVTVIGSGLVILLVVLAVRWLKRGVKTA